ncbi:unnamed protein product [Paramecium sonneborni]|uniref:Uncharacterized protein n=1 Tax=Paramecium sonneborni TaxID=65129 RepID=A0A8S1JW33_9CILI|nr:unnamed protein product [Paramecium sonneborni]
MKQIKDPKRLTDNLMQLSLLIAIAEVAQKRNEETFLYILEILILIIG